jgi:hypothetical protein
VAQLECYKMDLILLLGSCLGHSRALSPPSAYPKHISGQSTFCKIELVGWYPFVFMLSKYSSG